MNRKLVEEANNKIFTNKNINNIIFIYTPLKVGSTTIVSSIRLSAAHQFLVIHIHNETCLKVLTGIENVTINELILYNASIGKNVYVIDVYRSPIERKISEFFELISFHFNNSLEKINQYSIERVINRFNKVFPHIANEEHMNDNYNIIVPEEFDFDKKFLFTKQNNVNYIKLRLKDSNEWGTTLSLLLNTEIVIVNDYETNNKPIGELYEKFKKSYRIPPNLLENIKSNKYLNYYYSLEERNEYFDVWENKKGNNIVIPFSENEYNLYMDISVENNSIHLIQFNHYIDLGCLCKVCVKKRKELVLKVKRGEKINEKMEHGELVKEYCKEVNSKVLEKIVQYKKKNNLSNGNVNKLQIIK